MKEIVIDPPAVPALRPLFFCTEGHGATNNVIRLNFATYCVPCAIEVLQATQPEAIRMADFGA